MEEKILLEEHSTRRKEGLGQKHWWGIRLRFIGGRMRGRGRVSWDVEVGGEATQIREKNISVKGEVKSSAMSGERGRVKENGREVGSGMIGQLNESRYEYQYAQQRTDLGWIQSKWHQVFFLTIGNHSWRLGTGMVEQKFKVSRHPGVVVSMWNG